MHSSLDVRSILGTDEPVSLIAVSEEFDTWAIGSDRVAKFARSAVEVEKISVESAVHGLLRRELGAIVPAITAFGPAAAGDGPSFIVHERALGEAGQSVDGPTIAPAPGLAKHVGSILGRLHRVGRQEPDALGVGERTVTFEAPDIADGTRSELKDLVGDAATRFLESAPPLPSERRTLCHTDVKGEHVFVDAGRGRVTSIIDWADVEICDPAKDFAGVLDWLGPAFTREAIVASGEEDDGSLLDRAIWLTRAGLIGWMDDMLAGREPLQVGLLTQQIRTAFGE
jgi:aminoglycoside phosphotransferase (APT) family kinase protein